MQKIRKIVRPDVPAAISIALNQHQLRKLPQLPFLQQQLHQLEIQSLFWVLTIRITNHSLLISTVNIKCFPWILKLNFYSGNINQDLAFEYGDGTAAQYGCGSTLNNEFWYFGGSNKRQVKSQKYSLDIYLFYFRLVK